MSEMKYYKFMAPGCTGPFSDKKLEPGKWLPPIEGKLKLCRNGYHFCTAEHLAEWVDAELYAVEVRGETLTGGNKSCAREIRMTRIEKWNYKSARLFAADCAEQAPPLFEKQHPKDGRLRRAIRAARDFANGKVSENGLAAAGAAAWDAAGDASWDAARKWQSERIMYYIGEEVK